MLHFTQNGLQDHREDSDVEDMRSNKAHINYPLMMKNTIAPSIIKYPKVTITLVFEVIHKSPNIGR